VPVVVRRQQPAVVLCHELRCGHWPQQLQGPRCLARHPTEAPTVSLHVAIAILSAYASAMPRAPELTQQ
jgi:hypothetical protein